MTVIAIIALIVAGVCVFGGVIIWLLLEAEMREIQDKLDRWPEP